ncbi:Tetratricopeptide repeat protein 25 [Melipona quadrifasciata]|uniref:Tetratricopeptide repeat protein 25 n=1 Tax=Melipona quadrifasciata TaxID=166423 RepID=A0A0N0BGU8_9HYME|nr:Tetratricopeptide repeat protein 25 [Melipona quadrifasciata]
MAVLARRGLTDDLEDLNDTKRAVENAENRARLRQEKTDDAQLAWKNNREYAQALHREADQLYRRTIIIGHFGHFGQVLVLIVRVIRGLSQGVTNESKFAISSGDYESALVLYHRAGNLYPRDSSHGAAARRTVATISCCNNPAKAPRNVSSCSGERLTIALCPETAAITANQRLNKSPEPASIHEVLAYVRFRIVGRDIWFSDCYVAFRGKNNLYLLRFLREFNPSRLFNRRGRIASHNTHADSTPMINQVYFDNHKSYWKSLPSPRVCNAQLARTKMTFKQLNSLAETTLKNLEASFESGKLPAALKITQELLALSEGFQDPGRYQIAAYHYLSLIHVAMGRHDRAVRSASRLIRLSKSTENVAQVCRSLATLGKVHLSFGHLDAAAKAWQHLAKGLRKPIPMAWIRHEIGRCYLETGRYEKAAEMGFDCVDAATKANSSKWTLNGRLLLGQSLAKLGRFVESLEELQIAAKITEEEGDTPMLSYIRRLIDQVARALAARRPLREPARLQDCNAGARSSEETKPMTTSVFSPRKATTERPDSKGDADKTPSYRQYTARSDLEMARARGAVQLKRENSSDVSLRSGNTYVVQEGSRSLSENLEQVASDNEEEGGMVEVEEEGERATDGGLLGELLEYQEDGILGEERGDMLNAVRVIEELGKKDEVELLQMLRDMLLPTEEKENVDLVLANFR